MQQDSASFWADIKVYEEQLAANPDSFCFARLAEIYLKVGLVDDALHTARQGVARHPGYVAGQRALALACHARGLGEECRAALEQVTTAVPEDSDALKMLGRLYAGGGNGSAAIGAFRTVLEFNAEDAECRLELEAIERSSVAEAGDAGVVKAVPVQDLIDTRFVPFDEDRDNEGDVIEDIDILDVDEADLIEEEPAVIARPVPDASSAGLHQDPLVTTTLAELYVQQGIVPKALDIYQSILAADPANAAILARISELESEEIAHEGPQLENARFAAVDACREPGFNEFVVNDAIPDAASIAAAGAAVRDEGGSIVVTLEGWLENIRRMKACR